MYQCKECEQILSSVKDYVSHYEMHSNVHKIQFPCCVENWFKLFKSVSAFKSNVYQNHERADFSFSTSKANNSYQCNVNSCESKFMTLELLLKHLKRHISNGSTIKCPFPNCTFEYKKVPPFTSHISRKHINKGQSTAIDTVFFLSLLSS